MWAGGRENRRGRVKTEKKKRSEGEKGEVEGRGVGAWLFLGRVQRQVRVAGGARGKGRTASVQGKVRTEVSGVSRSARGPVGRFAHGLVAACFFFFCGCLTLRLLVCRVLRVTPACLAMAATEMPAPATDSTVNRRAEESREN